MRALCRWIESPVANYRFGDHIKIMEALIQRSTPEQVDKTICMNDIGQSLQASIDIVELQGLENPLDEVST